MNTPGHAEAITARDLMRAEVRTIEFDRPLRDALRSLADYDERRRPTPLVVTDGDGAFAGVVTPLALHLALLQGIPIDELGRLPEPDLLAAVRPQLDQPVSGVMVSEVPRACPDDRLFTLMKSATERQLDYTVVLDDGRVVGVIYVTDIFRAAASLALTHESGGISLPGDGEDLRH